MATKHTGNARQPHKSDGQAFHGFDGIVSISPDVQSGTPVFAGTRVPVQNLLDYIAGGDSIDEFVLDFPSVSREQIAALLSGFSDVIRDQTAIVDLAA